MTSKLRTQTTWLRIWRNILRRKEKKWKRIRRSKNNLKMRGQKCKRNKLCYMKENIEVVLKGKTTGKHMAGRGSVHVNELLGTAWDLSPKVVRERYLNRRWMPRLFSGSAPSAAVIFDRGPQARDMGPVAAPAP